MTDLDFFMIHGPYAERFQLAEYNIQIKASESGEDKEEEEQSYILQISDNIGVVSIKGMLTQHDSYWNRYFGMLSYQEIKLATIQALRAGVGAILYDFATPGGNASGMIDVADFFSSIPVPTIAHASGSMASAGYFLGMQMDHIHSSALSEVGSVGVICTLYDVTKMNERQGIKVERFRSGDLKAVGDPDFSLSDKEREYISNQISAMADVFFSAVSNARGIPIQMLEKLGITSGRTFMGQEAVGVGLVDSIQSFDKSVMKAYSLATNYLDKNTKRSLF
jgi:signal peptide peptidase SppA